jgi:anti-sigma factor RsiW
MQDSKFNEFKELNWRRPLRPSEQAELRRILGDHPADAQLWASEEALSRALEQLPTAPISSNFTARVLAAARRVEDSRVAPEPTIEMPWFLRSWWMRLAAGAAMMCAGFFSFQEYHANHLARLAAPRQVASATSGAAMADLPPVEWLDNFDTIQRLDKVKLADDELLSALE